MSEAKDDIYIAAQKFIGRFGSDAPRQAAMRAAELESAGDVEGSTMWRIIEAEALRMLKRPSPSEHLH